MWCSPIEQNKGSCFTELTTVERTKAAGDAREHHRSLQYNKSSIILSLVKTDYVLCNIHVGIYGNHLGGKMLAGNNYVKRMFGQP